MNNAAEILTQVEHSLRALRNDYLALSKPKMGPGTWGISKKIREFIFHIIRELNYCVDNPYGGPPETFSIFSSYSSPHTLWLENIPHTIQLFCQYAQSASLKKIKEKVASFSALLEEEE